MSGRRDELRLLAYVAIRDGENWNDRRLPEIGRALNEVLDGCPFCGHDWTQHDPADGMCDSHAKEGLGACPCGRDLAWMQTKIAALSMSDLNAAADARIARIP